MPKKPATPPEADDNILVSAAKAIGSAAGKIASLTGAQPKTPAKPKVGKLPKKQKPRLPRRQKKAQKKMSAAGKSATKRDAS